MRINFVLTSFFLFILGFTAFPQSVYQLKYKLPLAADTNVYHAFLAMYNDGTGFVRVKYVSQPTGDSILLQTDLRIQYPDVNHRNAGDDRIFYKLVNPKFLTGTDTAKYSPPVICFKKNAVTELYEPLGIITAAAYADTVTNTFEVVEPWGINAVTGQAVKKIIRFEAVELIENIEQKESFVLGYFNRTEDFYLNIFKPTKIRGVIYDPNMQLILLVVANINDPVIGGSCLKDMNRIVESFKTISSILKIKFVPKTISGKEYNKKNVLDAVKAIAPNPNDIVVFYYTGHGFRKPKNKDSRFPDIDLRPKNDNTYMVNSLHMEKDIFSMIKAKGARFNLVLSDCCNTEVAATNAEGDPVPKPRGFAVKWNTDNCSALFLGEKPMSILATAADEGQRATSNNSFGGFFSFFFKESLENYFSFSKTDVTWGEVLADTRANTSNKAEFTYCDKPYVPENICLQYPHFIIREGKF